MTSGKQTHSSLLLEHVFKPWLTTHGPKWPTKNKSFLLLLPPTTHRTCKRLCGSSLLHVLLLGWFYCCWIIRYGFKYSLSWWGLVLVSDRSSFVLLPLSFVISHSPGFLSPHITSQAGNPGLFYTKAGFQKIKTETIRSLNMRAVSHTMSLLIHSFCQVKSRSAHSRGVGSRGNGLPC